MFTWTGVWSYDDDPMFRSHLLTPCLSDEVLLCACQSCKTQWMVKYILKCITGCVYNEYWLFDKLLFFLWIKVSADCINVNLDYKNSHKGQCFDMYIHNLKAE